MKKLGLNLFLGLLVAVFAASQARAVTLSSDECVSAEGGVYSVALLAGQFIDAGSVTAEVVGENLVVAYSTKDGWELKEVHLWVGESLASLPKTRSGNPQIGLFPYKATLAADTTYYAFSIPLETLEFQCPSADKQLFLAAHASVGKELRDGSVQTETGWAEGPKINDKGSWATYFSIVLTCCEPEDEDPELGNCETAFAYHDVAPGFCFLDFDGNGDTVGDFSRWGWSIGPLAPSTEAYLFPIYSGAGQCDLDKGLLVGWLAVLYDGFDAQVSYNLYDGFGLTETHLFAGVAVLPVDVNGGFTVAPGQYPYITEGLGGSLTNGYVVSGFGGEDIYVVAHAVVCEVLGGEFDD